MPPRLKAREQSAAKGPGRPAPAEPAVEAGPRPVALTLARVHLRLGSLALARVELEILDHAGELDQAGQVDLAEVRWRTGDLAGAGEAAAKALANGDEDAVALAISAEAASADGRPNEARRLANRALERASGPIDALFAGMPRSAVWPADAADPPPTTPTLFQQEVPVPTILRAGETDPAVAASRLTGREPAEVSADQPSSPGLWDADSTPDPPRSLPDPADELEAARAAVASGALGEGLLRFGLVLRIAPALAPAVLEATDGLSGPDVSLLRGDAYRLVGLEQEARYAFATAAWSGTRDRRGRSPIDDSTEPGNPADSGEGIDAG